MVMEDWKLRARAVVKLYESFVLRTVGLQQLW